MKFNSKTALLVYAALILVGTAFLAVAIIAPGVVSNISPTVQLSVALVMGLSVMLAALLSGDPRAGQYTGP